MFSSENFERLKEEQENEKILREKFKEDYKTLDARLETLPYELKHDVMVPISKYAFMPGQLVNTNEILVLLGENWFVEKSAKQARDIVSRRLTGIDKQLDDLKKEKEIIDSQHKWTSDVLSEKGQYVNIEEKLEDSNKNEPQKKKNLTEEEKKELRRKQQEKALQFQKKIDLDIKSGYDELHAKPKEELMVKNESDDEQEPEENEEKVKIMGEPNSEKFDKILSEQSKITETDQEYNKMFDEMLKEYDKNIDRKNNEFMSIAIEKNFKQNQMQKTKKSVKWSDENLNKIAEIEKAEYDSDDYDEEDEDYDDYYEEDENDNITKPGPTPFIINIKHTQNDEIDQIDRKLKLSRDRPEINSPGDIYSNFYKPKSILKSFSTSSLSHETSDDVDIKKPVEKVEPKNAEMGKFEPEKAFRGEIVERLNPISENKSSDDFETGKKKVSKFKASKLN